LAREGPGLRIGDGVRELEDASDGEDVIEPSSEPRIDSVSCSDSTSIGACLRDDRVLIMAPASGISLAAAFRAGRLTVLATRCLGARGGLLAAGVNSMIGRSRTSQLYCLARVKPRSRGIQVPGNGFVIRKVSRTAKDQPWYFPYPPCTFSCSPF
jgi:hypothetical protein